MRSFFDEQQQWHLFYVIGITSPTYGLGKSPWLLARAAIALGAFSWLLSLHPHLGAGRTYAAYSGIYIAIAISVDVVE